MKIDGHVIGIDRPPYVIAELSANHNGDLQRACAIIETAKRAGADAVKLQTYRADTITIDHDGPGFIHESPGQPGRKIFDLYAEAHTPWEWHEALFAKGREVGITVFSSPFDFSAIEFLESLHAPAYKIASCEIVDLPLIARAAQTGKPLIISTGMSTLDEIDEAVNAAHKNGCRDLALLHCVSAYPTPFEEARLQNIKELQNHFDLPIGLSDHTLGIGIPIAAVALGAAIIEKHVTLKRADGGLDAAFSIEPEELADLVRNVRNVQVAATGSQFGPKPSEEATLIYRRSLYAVEDIPQGAALTAANVRSIRPALGLAPKNYDAVLSRKAARAIIRGEPLAWDMITDD